MGPTEIRDFLKTSKKIREAVEQLYDCMEIPLNVHFGQLWFRISHTDLINMTVKEVEKEMDKDPNPLQNFDEKIGRYYMTVLRDTLRKIIDDEVQAVFKGLLPDQS